MNKLICLFVLWHVVSAHGRICHTNEACVALLECRELMHSSPEVRAMNRCNQPWKYCCPAISSRMSDDLSTQKFPEDCGSTPMYGSDRVVGGRVIEPDEFSWLASLEYVYNGGTSGICGGAVINSRYVLTAAHCVTGTRVRGMGGVIAVRLGDFTKEQKCDYGTPTCLNFQRIIVEEIVVHRDYKEDDYRQMLNDISLLRLNKVIQFSNMMKPICLPFGNNNHILEPSANTWVTISGWGRTSFSSDDVAKRAVCVPIWQEDRCLNDTRRDQSQICTGIVGRGSCLGDSGGPVMNEFENKRMVLEGIVSYGRRGECGSKSFPTVSTRVRSFANLIEINMRM